jgi:hypothetical protein
LPRRTPPTPWPSCSRASSPHKSAGVAAAARHSIRLVGAVLAEQNDEWADGRRYLGLDILHRSRLVLITTEHTEEDKPAGAISA